LQTVTLTIDGRDIQAQKGSSILEAALSEGIYIPHLCHHPDLPPVGSCRLCVVEIKGADNPLPSCITQVANGMKVTTKTEQLDRMRKLAMELMLSGHPQDCSTCNKYLNCELQSLKQYLTVEDLRVRKRTKPFTIIQDNPLFVHDSSRCVLCGRCVRACHELWGVQVLFYKKKGRESYIGTASGGTLSESDCRFCGACAEVCPTGAIMDKEELVRGKNRRIALVPCKYACPAEIDVPRYIRYIQQRDYSAAVAVVREKVPFPGVLGYVCNRPCETLCRRGYLNQPVSIRDLKRYAAEHDETKIWEKARNKKPSTGKKVAIVGSGPSGLTAAYYLCNQGHSVTVFESLSEAGGMMRYGIPEYRLPREVLNSEIASIESMGVNIKTNAHIDSMDAFFENGFEAVLVAVGKQKSQKLSIPGIDSEGVFLCANFLRNANAGLAVSIGSHTVVLGGGNAAFDCARVARRLGAERVHLVCIESRTEMPASADEIGQGEAEGILIYPSKTAVRILSEEGRVVGVEFLDVESFCFDEDKSLQLEVVEDSHQSIEADTVIVAVGQEPEIPAGFDFDLSPAGFVELDPYTLQTSREGVFASGDAVEGAGSLIEAIASGRKSAVAIDRFLEGSGVIDETLAPVSEPAKYIGSIQGFASMQRIEENSTPAQERIRSFSNVVQGMTDDAASDESLRCLQCDLRLKIKTVKSWGSY
jgi:formate dehydrogenase beta subunit